ncbi:phosphoribosylaminoimidazolesuccinocarboxamide synthase [Pseudalkalibacillus berkeleyi]|uniref:Phosphoribosylaminoimidazole-succinocarboxamide synthase n=1 Tax=Pseudalkalibacillus berkeleyi TaxID=1069813 RepID=A0ABS9H641_9BACL|nr:phosphoribosylaminoimidazolesuccinocarboxamide synthase [Pseudalkalibacillus berkeleyi]MCF6139135.1 phosphoribosylaminoimidazolesuccinocarboxamide synthase [Pseudalkalibacillus berkeleyi]
MEKQALLYEGKAKRVYETNDEKIVWIEYKDEATAFNGEKKTTIAGKGKLNNEISALLFEKLREKGIESHFVKKLSETEQLVKNVQIIPLEVVVRNIAAGSLAKRLGMEEGEVLPETIVEFYYKNDDLGDPLLTRDHIRILGLVEETELALLREKGLAVNDVLVPYFKNLNIDLVDFKLEFGIGADGEVMLADEISPDTCRLWDAETGEKLDKDVFRRDLGSLTETYSKLLERLTVAP